MTPAPRLALFTIVATLAYLGLAIVGSGGFALFFSHPALVALAVALFAMSGVALFSEGNLSPGEREDRDNRWVIVAFGLIGALAGLCARTPVQRAGRHPARPYARHERRLSCPPPPQLSGLARQFARMGPCFSLWRRLSADSASHPAAPRSHTCGRKVAARAIRRRVRWLLQSYVATASRALLKKLAAMHQAVDGPAKGSACTPRNASNPVAAAATTANRQALKKMCVGAIPKDSR